MKFYLPINYLLVSSLLTGCQVEQKTSAHTPSAPHSSIDMPPAVRPPAATPQASITQLAGPPTLYPDTLHPRAVAYHVWTTAEIDTMQGERLPVADVRYRLLDVHNTPAYGDGLSLRFFCRMPGAPAKWLELDLSNPLSEFRTDLYIEPQTIELNQRPPAELLLRLGGRNDGNSSGKGVGYTLLLSLATTPTVVWQSVDVCTQTIRPLLTAADTTEETSFTSGNQESEAHRRVTVRRGIVLVSRISHSTAGDLGEQDLTPITPGRYQYRGGKFKWIGAESP